ncbi:hypothetical protein Fmac_028643 [Flemingia macrophylla]|uniref:Uncharacterized protein n=1 Tax=Flemingia macrophylla TaxID=520843 RepID=A0ABD1L826_9FABA
MAPNSWQFSARNDAIIIRGVHDGATDTSAENRQLEGKLDPLVNTLTQLTANQKPTSIARVCGIRSSNDHHTSVCPSSPQSGVDDNPEAYAANTYSGPPQQIHDVATVTSTKTRKLDGKLDAHVNLVTQLAANPKPSSIARVCNIRSSNDHHTSACPSSQQSRVDDNPEDYAKGGRQAYALVNLVNQLATNKKPASVARVYDIHSSNDHHASVCPSSQQSGVDEHPEAYVVNTYSIPPQQ